MPYGSAQLIRHALMHAKPLQRYVISGAMIVGGAALVAVGHVAGVLLAGAGVLIIGGMLRHRTQSRQELGPSGGASNSDWKRE